MTILSVSESLARKSENPPPPPMDSWLAHSKVPQGQTDELCADLKEGLHKVVSGRRGVHLY